MTSSDAWQACLACIVPATLIEALLLSSLPKCVLARALADLHEEDGRGRDAGSERKKR